MASVSSSPRTVEEIFKDFSARRGGIIRALTYGSFLCILFIFQNNFDEYLTDFFILIFIFHFFRCR